MTKTSTSYEKLTVKTIDKSRVEITGSVPTDIFESFRKKALQNINEEVTIDGFRKGKVPESTLISKVGEMTILEEMAELALSQAYPKIVTEEKIDALGRPEIQITKIATGNPLEFKIVTAVVPDIKLGDYKKIAEEELKKVSKNKNAEEMAKEISEKEIDEAILNIRRSRVNHGGHDHEKISAEDHAKLVDASLPEFNDEFVKSLGNFADIADFKEKIKVMLAEEKISKEKDKERILVSDRLIESSSMELPDILVESELGRIESQFSDDITRMGVKIEDYLQHAKKSLEDLRKDWRPHAEKKAKLQLILNKIAETEKLAVAPEDIEAEVKRITEHYKDADRGRASIYAETVLMNEKVFGFLEN